MQKLVTLTIVATAFLLCGCGPPPPVASFPVTPPKTLPRSEVLEKFRSRVTPAEVQEFERLVAATDSDSETRALQLVLFKLTAEELFDIGITQNGPAEKPVWAVAESRGFSDSGRAFEQALASIGVSPSGTMDLGIVGSYVPREQFFTARRALLSAGLKTNEITITEPRFTLR